MSSIVRFVQRKLQSIVAITAMMFVALGAFATPALATELDKPIIKDPISRFSTDPEDIIASCAGSIENANGYLNCYMTYGAYYATFQAKTGPNGNLSGSVDCYIEYPNGNSYSLGAIPVSNGETAPFNVYYCPFGNYKFIFQANVTDPIEVQGFIFA